MSISLNLTLELNYLEPESQTKLLNLKTTQQINFSWMKKNLILNVSLIQSIESIKSKKNTFCIDRYLTINTCCRFTGIVIMNINIPNNAYEYVNPSM